MVERTKAVVVLRLAAWLTATAQGCSGVAESTATALPEATAAAATALAPEECAASKQAGVRPFVIHWDATDQAEFVAHSEQSITVMRLEGCDLTLLPTCSIPGTYVLRQTSGNLQSLEIETLAELRTELPLGFVKLGGELGGSGSLLLKYYVDGLRTATAPVLFRESLPAGCEGATHFVLNYASGAYVVRTASETHGSAKATAGGAGGSAAAEHSAEALLSGGDLDSCGADDDQRCGAPIRLRLLPVADGAPPAEIAPVAEQGLKLPPAKPVPAKMKLEDEQVFKSALKKTLHLGAESCVEEYPPESWGEQGMVVLSYSIAFGPDGVPTEVVATVPEGMPPMAEAVECAVEFGWSARYMSTGAIEKLEFPDIQISKDR